jgi:hypothetical protein
MLKQEDLMQQQTCVVLDDLESTVIQMGLEVLRSASPSVMNAEQKEFYQSVIDGVIEKIDTAEKMQHPTIEVA